MEEWLQMGSRITGCFQLIKLLLGCVCLKFHPIHVPSTQILGSLQSGEKGLLGGFFDLLGATAFSFQADDQKPCKLGKFVGCIEH